MGKGVYIWQPEKIGTPAEVVQALIDAGVDTVAIKINDAGRVFTGLQPYIDAFRAAGIRVIGWGYIYLKWNALAEAQGEQGRNQPLQTGDVPDRRRGTGQTASSPPLLNFICG